MGLGFALCTVAFSSDIYSKHKEAFLFPGLPILEGLNCINRVNSVKQFPVMVEGQKASLLFTQCAEHLPTFSFLQLHVFPEG